MGTSRMPLPTRSFRTSPTGSSTFTDTPVSRPPSTTTTMPPSTTVLEILLTTPTPMVPTLISDIRVPPETKVDTHTSPDSDMVDRVDTITFTTETPPASPTESSSDQTPNTTMAPSSVVT